jgi:hypothetical protein
MCDPDHDYSIDIAELTGYLADERFAVHKYFFAEFNNVSRYMVDNKFSLTVYIVCRREFAADRQSVSHSRVAG